MQIRVFSVSRNTMPLLALHLQHVLATSLEKISHASCEDPNSVTP